MDQRLTDLSTWVAKVLDLPEVNLSVVSGDASFRRYFRLVLNVDGQVRSWVAMDAPPDKEDSSSFVAIARDWLAQGVAVPNIEALDLELGFLLLSDMGDELLLSRLCPEQPNHDQGDIYYHKAMDTLVDIQGLETSATYVLPPYDKALLQREMALFRDWLLVEKLGLVLSDSENLLLDRCFAYLEGSALAQLQVPVHRDFHARNLMILSDDSLGVIDFQDAVFGPVTYDLVSLLKDCYIVWPAEKVDQWCQYFYSQLKSQNKVEISYSQFKLDFELMGMQRHLKAAGIFARLSLRDGKHGYLDDIPRVVSYIITTCQSLEAIGGSQGADLKAMADFLNTRVLPVINQEGFLDVGSDT